MNKNYFFSIFALIICVLFIQCPVVEARHCNRSRVQFQFNHFAPQPQIVQRTVVRQPVIMQPQPVVMQPVVYYPAAYPVVAQPVYATAVIPTTYVEQVYTRPVAMPRNSFSFSWGFLFGR